MNFIIMHKYNSGVTGFIKLYTRSPFIMVTFIRTDTCPAYHMAVSDRKLALDALTHPQ